MNNWKFTPAKDVISKAMIEKYAKDNPEALVLAEMAAEIYMSFKAKPAIALKRTSC